MSVMMNMIFIEPQYPVIEHRCAPGCHSFVQHRMARLCTAAEECDARMMSSVLKPGS
jgi:hypothetical protein